jgi:hypothetical protein
MPQKVGTQDVASMMISEGDRKNMSQPHFHILVDEDWGTESPNWLNSGT